MVLRAWNMILYKNWSMFEDRMYSYRHRIRGHNYSEPVTTVNQRYIVNNWYEITLYWKDNDCKYATVGARHRCKQRTWMCRHMDRKRNCFVSTGS